MTPRSRTLTRRAVLAAGAAMSLSRRVAAAQATPEPMVISDSVAMTANGPILPGLESLDRAVAAIMSEWKLPGAQLAIASGPNLALNRGYGIADPIAGAAVTPDSRFRIASVSKPITAVVALALVDAGALVLDEPVIKLLQLEPPRNAVTDPRMREITLRMLLTHSAGFDSTNGLDPQYLPMSAAEANLLGVDNPPTAEQIVRAMLGRPLDFDPGTKSVYSNFGFNVVGRVIEAVTGDRFGEVAQRLVLEPSGAKETKLGQTRFEDRAKHEVFYSAPEGAPLVESVFPGEGYVPYAYGGYFLEAMDSHGGFISTASDLLRFALAVDGTRGPALLTPETLKEMLDTPRPGGSDEPGGGAKEYGLGWGVEHTDAGLRWSHAGALSDTCASALVRRPDGLSMAVLFNSIPTDYGAFFSAMGPALEAAIDAIPTWPDGDLFEKLELVATPSA
ncbi:MAG: serine hydrolase domain-containing protein [Thermomicrobiales bacterium]